MKSKFSPFVLTLVFGTIITCGVLIENAQAGQPHMMNALESLRSARHQLEVAEHDKGGHRDNAIADIDAAIVRAEQLHHRRAHRLHQPLDQMLPSLGHHDPALENAARLIPRLQSA